MLEFLINLFASDFMGHGYCYLWRPQIVWLHVVSDGLIMLAYYSIPVTLVYFVRKRRDLPFHWIFLMFGAFILSCGTTHAMEVWTVWHGTYRLAGIVKLITAGLSVGTAVALVPLIPKALVLPSPAQLEAANQKLHREIGNRQRADGELQKSRDQLRALAARLQTVREEERTGIAREIHDELGQALTAIKLDLTALVRDLPRDEEPAVFQRSRSILKLLDQEIQSVQRMATELRPGILDDLGLAAAVEWAAEDFEARTGTKCRISMPDEDITVDPDRATALFRIFQETLTNVARHAKATEVNVRLAEENGVSALKVHDNGLGIREEQISAGESLGILGMRERARLLGGELTIQGVPGGATTVSVRIPLAEPQTAGIAK